MHALFIPSWYPSHPDDISGSFFREQALALSASGMKVGVITPFFRSLTSLKALWRGGYGIKAEIDRGLPTVRVHGVRAFSWNDGLNMRFWESTGLRAFKAYVKANGRPDVLHVHCMIFGIAWATAIHREYGIPFVVTEHSSEYALTTIRPNVLSYLAKNVLRASALLAVSSSLRAILERRFPAAPAMQWRVMPNLVSAKFSQNDVTVSFQPDSAGGCVRLLSVGALQLNKGQHHLLQALALARAGGVDARLRICGEGPQEMVLRKLSANLGLDDRVGFVGKCSREQVAREMADCDVFVVSSSYETFGVVAIEALMSGRPVIATRCGEPEDIVGPGDGHLVEKDSPAALASGILDFIRKRKNFDSQAIRRRCVEKYSEAAFVERHASLYKAVLQ